MRGSVYLGVVAALAALSSCSGLYFQINENEVRVSARCCCPPMPVAAVGLPQLCSLCQHSPAT